jgi:Cu-Zn family superoxide dismutase
MDIQQETLMKRLCTVMLAALIAAACERVEDAPEPALQDTTANAPEPAASQTVEVQLMNAQGTQTGIAHLTPEGDSVQIHVRIEGLEPGSEHGLHFHQVALCTPPGFESAGDHFNPTNRQHGLENPNGPHAGDLPNLRAGDNGVAESTFRIGHPRIGGPAGTMGDTAAATAAGDSAAHGASNALALVVHADRDDLRTDPSGNSGARIACGVAQMQ